jgi:hypothetical protein
LTRTVLAALTTLAVAAAVPSLALAKGPSAATIDGPGLAQSISVPVTAESSGAFWTIVERVGFFPAVFRQVPDPMLSKRPRGSLGPRYVMTYELPGPNGVDGVLRQDVYPYAKPRPVSYMQPGQSFFVDQETHGGWFVSEPSLKRSLVGIGLPTRPPAVGGSASFQWKAVGALAVVVALLGLGTLAVVLVRRRPQPAT